MLDQGVCLGFVLFFEEYNLSSECLRECKCDFLPLAKSFSPMCVFVSWFDGDS
jgi:hypothetical protein